jgi:2-oxoglutarate ferredoxin oxidoreductase subunit alpha
MGNGVWTVEIIPAEIKPPARSRAGASGIRVRLGEKYVTNMGDEADLAVAFNEQVLYGRLENRAYKKGTVVLLENKWADDPVESIRDQYQQALRDFEAAGLVVRELPMEQACLAQTDNPRLGKNMFVLGMLCEIFGRDLERAKGEVALVFRGKGAKVVEMNHRLLEAGYGFAAETVDLALEIPPWNETAKLVVMNGNQATGLGVMASGMEMVAMYPITPATSASHYLAEAFSRVGGCLHQAEDEIAAVGFAIGASYAGKTACTITSGPGLALKTEFIGLAVMAEVPLVIVVVQRGGPSTGLPTKVEQGDLLAAAFGAPGDAPKVIMAPSTIEECFHFVITARRLAEAFRTPVMLLTDANLATGVQPFVRPEPKAEWMAPPIDQSPWDPATAAYDWDQQTGISPRPIPGQAGGQYVLTGLAHDRRSKVAYDPESNQGGCNMRSRKLAALARTLRPPKVHGDEQGGDLLLVGWGSTRGSIEEAVDRARAEGHNVSSVHLHFISPLEPGLKEIFGRFKRAMTIEINYSDKRDDPAIPADYRRMAQLAFLLRANLLLDIDCWSEVNGLPITPRQVYDEALRALGAKRGGN